MDVQGIGRRRPVRGEGPRPRHRGGPRPPVEVLEARQLLAQVFTVTDTADSGTGSLRWAIGQVNADTTDTTASPDQIHFAIPATDPGNNTTTGVCTIAPLSALPTVTRPVVIDGYTQAGASPNTLALGDNAVITVQLDGTDAAATADGLAISGGNSTVRGLSITRFASGIHFTGLGGDAATGDFLGVDASGSAAAGNASNGVFLDGTSGAVGGPSAALRNIISGNGSASGGSVAGDGILVLNAAGAQIQGNFLGTDRTGTRLIGATGYGIDLDSAAGATVGGQAAGARNIISGSGAGDSAVLASGSDSVDDLIEGNLIGTDVTGEVALGNFIGIDVGAYAKILGNVVSGSSSAGIEAGASNLIQGNLIGTDQAGSAPLPNAGDGIFFFAGGNTVGGVGAGNLVSANGIAGIWVTPQTDGNNLIQGNRVGTNLAGTGALGNRDGGIVDYASLRDTIGGASLGEGNLVSGNHFDGIDVTGVAALVQGNLVGVDASGTRALGNAADGLVVSGEYSTVGGASAGEGNVISGNGGSGIELDGFTSFCLGNFIGTDASGTRRLGNAGDGITERGSLDIIGWAGIASNTIAFNGGAGINLPPLDQFGDTFLPNSIHDNAKLGIDLGDDGVTPNTPGGPHAGPNYLQNYPVLTAVTSAGDSTTITGTLNSAPNLMFALQFFASPTADPSGYGEGEVAISATEVKTDADGNASFSVVVPIGLAGQFITATATDGTGSTSEFSKAVQAVAVPIADIAVAVDQNPGTSVAGSPSPFSFRVTNDGPSTATNVVISDVLPATLAYTKATVSQGTFTLDGQDFTATIPSLASGDSVIVTFQPGQITALGPVTDTLAAASATLDPDPTNNVAGLTFQAVGYPSSVSLAAAPSPSAFGQAVTFTATVQVQSVLNPYTGIHGTVTFAVDGKPVATADVIQQSNYGVYFGPATAQFTTSGLAAGSHVITATYEYVGYAQTSVSGPLTQVVARAATATTVVASPSPGTAGRPVTFTATVAPVVPADGPTGVVVFDVNGVGTVVPSPGGTAGTATLTTTLPAGSYQVLATYGGDANFAPSVSTPLAETINPAPVPPPPPPPPPPSGPPPRAIEVLRFGYHAAPTALVVEFNEPLDPATAQNPANYVIVGPRRMTIPVVSAVLAPGGTAVVLQPRARLNLHAAYTLTVSGSIKGATGQAIGSDQVELVTGRNLVLAQPRPHAAPRPRPHAVDAALASARLGRLEAIAAHRRR